MIDMNTITLSSVLQTLAIVVVALILWIVIMSLTHRLIRWIAKKIHVVCRKKTLKSYDYIKNARFGD